MGVNSLPKTVTWQRRGCDLNPGPSAPESSTPTTPLPSHAERLVRGRCLYCRAIRAAFPHPHYLPHASRRHAWQLEVDQKTVANNRQLKPSHDLRFVSSSCQSRSQHMNWTELNSSSCTQVTQLHDAWLVMRVCVTTWQAIFKEKFTGGGQNSANRISTSRVGIQWPFICEIIYSIRERMVKMVKSIWLSNDELVIDNFFLH